MMTKIYEQRKKFVVFEPTINWEKKLCDEPLVLDTPRKVYNLFKRLKNEPTEHFIAVYLNTKLKTMAIIPLFKGSPDYARITPKEIYRNALLLNSDTFITIHNHPSGDPTPSSADKDLFYRLEREAKILELRSIDHIIIGDGKYYSFSSNEIEEID